MNNVGFGPLMQYSHKMATNRHSGSAAYSLYNSATVAAHPPASGPQPVGGSQPVGAPGPGPGGAHGLGGAGGGARGSAARNMLVCVCRDASGSFAELIRAACRPPVILYTLQLDLQTTQQWAVDSFSRFAFERMYTSSEPGMLAFAVEDPALMGLAQATGILAQVMRHSVLRNYALRDRCDIYTLVSNSIGGAHDASVAASERFQAALRAHFSRDSIHVLCNSILVDLLSPHLSFTFQHAGVLAQFFDLSALAARAATDASMQPVVESLQRKLAYVSDLKTMMVGAKYALIMDELAQTEEAFKAVQEGLLGGTLPVTGSTLMASVSSLETQLRDLLARLQDVSSTNTGGGTAGGIDISGNSTPPP